MSIPPDLSTLTEADRAWISRALAIAVHMVWKIPPQWIADDIDRAAKSIRQFADGA